MQLQPSAASIRHKRLSCPSVKPHSQGVAGVCSLWPPLRGYGRRPRDSVILRQVPLADSLGPHWSLAANPESAL